LNVGRKVDKANIYQDKRANEDENMENWDQEQLELAIADNEKVCFFNSHFLEPVQFK
jgi:hypothetical protein